MRIALATGGRFHLLDLARELRKRGHDVSLYSYVPLRRARRFGLQPECHVGLLGVMWPAVAWERLAPRFLPNLRERVMFWLLNQAVMWRLKPCDVFICMSGMFVEAPLYARQHYGARVVVHRGSKHIILQNDILAGFLGAERPTDYVIQRELASYRLADKIEVPSAHAEYSFQYDSESFGKVYRNPLGVDVNVFSSTASRHIEDKLTFVFAGLWCIRKGCDLLIESMRLNPHFRLLHVGSVGDLDLPVQDAQFTHLDKVDQFDLLRIYERVDAMILVSREDGFGMVLSQGLASGLPVICTTETGGPDLALSPALADRIFVIPPDDVDALCAAIAKVRKRLQDEGPFPPLSQEDLQALTWQAYAERGEAKLMQLVK